MIMNATAAVADPEMVKRKIQENVEKAAQASPQTIERRLCELDCEWDVDRSIEAMMASVSLAGLALAPLSPWFLAMTVGGSLSALANAVFCWRPFTGTFRTLGFRTTTEIDYERYALKVLRGDFQHLAGVVTPQERESLETLEGEGGIVAEAERPSARDPKVVEAAVDAVQK